MQSTRPFIIEDVLKFFLLNGKEKNCVYDMNENDIIKINRGDDCFYELKVNRLSSPDGGYYLTPDTKEAVQKFLKANYVFYACAESETHYVFKLFPMKCDLYLFTDNGMCTFKDVTILKPNMPSDRKV